MKISKNQLLRIIKEELEIVLEASPLRQPPREVAATEPERPSEVTVTPQMIAVKHLHALVDALEEAGSAEWVKIIRRLQPELIKDLDVEAQDVFTSVDPKVYTPTYTENQKRNKRDK